jgi:hypothetical protein
MKDPTIEAHVRTLNGIIASFAHAKKEQGQFAREREAVEFLDKAKDKLLAELKSREDVKTPL